MTVAAYELAEELAKMVAYELIMAGRGTNTPTDRQYHLTNVEVWMQAQEMARTVEPASLLELAETEAKKHWRPAPTVWSEEIGASYFRARAWQKVVHAGWKDRPDVAPAWPMPR